MAPWKEGLEKLSEAHAIPSQTDWIACAWAKRQIHSEKHFASHHEDGWLVILRHDRVDPRRVAAAVNDNEEDNAQTDTVCKTN